MMMDDEQKFLHEGDRLRDVVFEQGVRRIENMNEFGENYVSQITVIARLFFQQLDNG